MQFPKELEEKYVCLSELGRGAMGVVFHARQPELNRLVAIKLFASRSSSAKDHQARFLEEGRLAAKVNHPNVVTVLETGATEAGDLYIVYEYLDGRTLSSFFDRGQRFSVEEARALILGLLRGVEAMHNAGIIHRDLKADNVLVLPGGQPKIVDFGLARDLQDLEQRTKAGAIVGTPKYLAPEVIRGARAGPPADLYAIGLLLYESLSGSHPFPFESVAECLTAHLTAKVPDLEERRPDLSPELLQVIDSLLAKDPADRPVSAARTAKLLASIPWTKPQRDPMATTVSGRRVSHKLQIPTLRRTARTPRSSVTLVPIKHYVAIVIAGCVAIAVGLVALKLTFQHFRAASDQVQVGRLFFEPGRLTAFPLRSSPSGAEGPGEVVPCPIAFPLTPGGTCGKAVISASDAARALLAQIGLRSAMLEKAPGYSKLRDLEKSLRGRPPADAIKAIDAALSEGPVLKNWMILRDHAGPILAQDLDPDLRDKLMALVYDLEDLGARLSAFRFPVPVDISVVYPVRSRPGCGTQEGLGQPFKVEWLTPQGGGDHDGEGRRAHGFGRHGRLIAASTTLSGRLALFTPPPAWATTHVRGIFNVPPGGHPAVAWLACDLVSHSNVLRLHVRINDRITLRPGRAPCFGGGGNEETFHLLHTFDGSILRSGENTVVLDVGTCLDILRGGIEFLDVRGCAFGFADGRALARLGSETRR